MLRIYFFGFLFILCNLFRVFAQNSIYDLRVENLKEPLGVPCNNLRFSWKIESAEYGFKQESFRIQVSQDSSFSSNASVSSRESEIISDDMQLFLFADLDLGSNELYYWRVELWDSKGNPLVSPYSKFVTGLRPDKWSGDWIHDGKSIEDRSTSVFYKQFNLSSDPVNGRCYIATLGLHHITINGEEITDEFLNPIYTNYDKRILYNVYDVGNYLDSGANVLTVTLGNGWYNHQPETIILSHQAPWRNRPMFNLELVINENNEDVVVRSDSTWKYIISPITFNSIYLSENYDDRYYFSNENEFFIKNEDWSPAVIGQIGNQIVEPQLLPPIRRVESFDPLSVDYIDDHNIVIKFPQNISGTARIGVENQVGTLLTIKYGEQLNDIGRVELSNLTNQYLTVKPYEDFQTDFVRLNKLEGFVHESTFGYRGFQYLDIISSKPIIIDEVETKAYFTHSDVTPIGSFTCSSDLINRIWEATQYSYLSNLQGYPTDCPQREKNGWTGDAHIMVSTGLMMYDASSIYEKWMDDHRDAQLSSGQLPAIIPSPGWGYDFGSVDWTSSMVIIPWEVFMHTGDSTILMENFASMTSFMDFWYSNSKNLIPSEGGFGDWNAVNPSSSRAFINSMYLFKNSEIMQKVSHYLGKEDESLYFEKMKNNIRKSILKVFVDKAEIFSDATQTEFGLAIDFDLTSNETSQLTRLLSNSLKQNSYFLDFGLIGSKVVPYALSKNGKVDDILEMLNKTSYPSWGHWIANGATTLFESWEYDGLRFGGSQNHAFLGSVSGWMFNELGGINPDPDSPGFKNVILNPRITKHLTFVESSHNGPFGNIGSSWQWKDDHSVLYDVEIPPNSTATFHIPPQFKIVGMSPMLSGENSPKYIMGNRGVNLVSGKYEFLLSNREEDEFLPLEYLQLYNEGTFGRLSLESESVYFLQGEILAESGTYILMDISGKKIISDDIDYSKSTLLLNIDQSIKSGQLYILRLQNKYVDGSAKTHALKLKVL